MNSIYKYSSIVEVSDMYRGGIIELKNVVEVSDMFRGGIIEALHYGDVIIGVLASQITSLAIVYSTVHSRADQRKHQSSASLAFVREIHR